MANTLHITNGDSTAEILKRTSIKGNIVVWREMLCEGPICKEVGSDEFWMERYNYFEKELEVSKLEYYDKTIKEIQKLEDVSGYSEVVLWFEFDLFCQVNLMALCTYLLKSFRKNTTYNLVCTGRIKGEEKLKSLADFSVDEFANLYDNKTSLSKTNLEFAQNCWNVYVNDDIEELKSFNFNKQSKFRYLQKAINQHLLRYPNESGLNQIQYKVLEIINSKPLTEREIIPILLIWQSQETVYGFGDLQYFQYLNKLNKYYTISDSKYILNEDGKSIFK